ncbi:MAG: putative F420-dependent oxidoreductase, Rv2161c family [Jatrophihabitans sp.]|nr:putative F420-dependent oxidoreductase, Rv2161c family [Jatrophihabitans sp.]
MGAWARLGTDRPGGVSVGGMQIGVVFPQTELGGDVAAVRQFGQAVEQQGYRHLLVYDHVVGADPAVHSPWRGPYDVDTTFHEPFVLFGFLAGVTALELVTGVIILPQRQTVLVAKQAAEIDLLTGGRFRLGVGVGWNRVEYDALGQDFTTRGRRSGEQVELLRRLWTQRSVDATVDAERVIGAGIAPAPVQRPIPVWFGCSSPPAYRRAGRLGDGWFPQVQPGPELDDARMIVEGAAREAGRDVSTLGMEGRVSWRGDVDETAAAVERWRSAGATHLSINTMGAGLSSVDEHVAAFASLASVLGLDRAR